MRQTLLSILLSILCLLGCTTNMPADTLKVAEKSAATDIPETRTTLYYNGWAAIKRQHFDENAPDDDWIFMKDIRTDDQGQFTQILDDGKPTGYSIQLIVITYENTNTTVLKLALLEDGNDKSITYIWGQPGAERLGMNLRWIQVGLTQEKPDNEKAVAN